MRPAVPTYSSNHMLLDDPNATIDFTGSGDTLTFLYGGNDMATMMGANQTVLAVGMKPPAPGANTLCIQDFGSNLGIEAEFMSGPIFVYDTAYDAKAHVQLLPGQT